MNKYTAFLFGNALGVLFMAAMSIAIVGDAPFIVKLTIFIVCAIVLIVVGRFLD